ncbi:MAG: ROK family protein [Acidimicrobiaceae bacterium]|nr:ROK family protein [Acidimicrobiaceae bacterium]
MIEVDATSEVIAIDVGGTFTKAARIDVRGVARSFAMVPTPVAEGPEAILELAVSLARSLETPNVIGVGVVVPGIVDSSKGVARYSANLGWRDWPLRDLMEERLLHRVNLGHDVMAAGETEMRTGAGIENGLVVVIGTGIASVTVLNGEVVKGAQGMAGELGHVVVRNQGALCRCGNRGCLEAYASTGALPLRFRDLGGGDADAESIVRELSSDSFAQEVWSQAIDCLATALAMVVSILDPGKIVIAGGLSLAGEALTTPLSASLNSKLLWRASPPIELSHYQQHAGVVGAAMQFYRTVGLNDFSTWSPGLKG